MKLLYYGLQRSGTNFLEVLLKRKYRVRFLNSNEDRSSPLQKHFRLYDDKEIIPDPQYRNNLKIEKFNDFEELLEIVPDYYLIISKDPYSWLISYNSWARKCSWPSVPHHYIIEYNQFYGKWLDFSQDTGKIVFTKYKDLLQNTDAELSRLGLSMNLKKKFLYPFISRTVDKVSQSEKFSADRRSYYLNEQYLKEYTKEELQEINDLIQSRVINLLGYQKKRNVQ